MADTLTNQNWPSNARIIRRMQEHIDANLGENTWDKLAAGGAPAPNMNDAELSRATSRLVAGFDELANSSMANTVFSQVRHGLAREDFQWAREKFLRYGDLDAFAEALLEEELQELQTHMQHQTLFYGQPITPEVYNFVSGVDDLLYGKRRRNQISATAIPFQAANYLRETDERKKRYYLCHCQFARESILGDAPVSKTMCYCSLGHNLMFWETALDTELKGDVLASALGGDAICRFVIDLPDEIMKKYVRKS